MDYLYCEVFPRPGKDPLAGLDGERRKEELRKLATEVGEFLKSGEGLLAAPRKPMFDFRLENVVLLSVDPELACERVGIPGVTEVTVRYADNGKAFTTLFTDDIMHINRLHPMITVTFETLAEWPVGTGALPFYHGLARVLRVGPEDIVFGYSVDWDPDVGMPPR